MSAVAARPAPVRPDDPPRRAAGRAQRARSAATSWTMLAPALLLFGVFLVYPLGRAVATSFTDADGITGGSFVGLANYTTMAGDPTFWRAAANTVGLAVVSVPIALALGLLMAVLLSGPVPGRWLFRALFLAPVVVSGVVVGMTGQWMFDENVGVVNAALGGLGLDPVRWQSSGGPAAASVLTMLTWSRVGLVAVIYLGALLQVPGELLEQAQLDGASRWQRMRDVVWPQLRPTTFFLTVVLVIETFQVFDLVFVMTGGGPGVSTELLVTYLYAEGFEARRQGYGTAIGVVVLVVVLAFTAVWWRAQRHTEDEL